jgi:hypothetical protein
MWVRVVAFLLLVATACYLSWWVWKSALRQRRRERWPRATGTVLEQRMRERGNSILLEYLVAYEFEGVDYQRVCSDWEPGGYTIPYRSSTRFRGLMQKRLDAYPQGGPIALMIDPGDPGKAYYRRGWTWPLTAMAVAVSLVFLGLVALLTPVIFQAP